MSDVLASLEKLRLVPVIEIDREQDAVPLARALVEGGLPVAEVTFRTAAAEGSLRAMGAVKEILAGAGTITTVEEAKRALGAGAKFIVSPGLAPAVVKFAQENKIPIFPGVATPTEIMAALDLGAKVLKFFPAEALGGVKTLKAFSGPFGAARFIPTGGISTANLKDYLSMPKVVAVGGSWMVKPELLRAGNFAEVTKLAREAVELARAARPS